MELQLFANPDKVAYLTEPSIRHSNKVRKEDLEQVLDSGDVCWVYPFCDQPNVAAVIDRVLFSRSGHVVGICLVEKETFRIVLDNLRVYYLSEDADVLTQEEDEYVFQSEPVTLIQSWRDAFAEYVATFE